MDRFTIEVVYTGAAANECLKFYQYDIIILDWEMPEMTGVDVCREFRSRGGRTPILFLTGKAHIKNKEEGFLSGGDDYLTKPFDMKELTLRLQSLLRRPQGYSDLVLSAGHVTIEPTSYRVLSKGREVQLQPLEFSLLEFMMRHKDQVFSGEALVNHVWGSGSDATTETIRTYIKQLRKKLEVEGEPSIITTIFGLGYKVEG